MPKKICIFVLFKLNFQNFKFVINEINYYLIMNLNFLFVKTNTNQENIVFLFIVLKLICIIKQI